MSGFGKAFRLGDRVVGGAYPSIVTLKDGSILIVYYEEGAGSSIRAKRFRITRQGIDWLPVGDAQNTMK
jgi:hypothetical protein